MNSYYRSFSCGFLFGCKGREGECLRTVHYSYRGGLEAAPPQWRQVMLNLSLNFKSRAWRNFLFSSEQQISHFFFSVVIVFFLANVYFVYSSLASIVCEAQTYCGSSLLSLPRGFAARSRVLARFASLAQIGELASRLFFYVEDRKPKLWLGLHRQPSKNSIRLKTCREV